MFRNKTLAWAFACALAGGTAAAAQVIVYPDRNETPEPPIAAARASKLVPLESKALASDEIRVAWGSIGDDSDVTLEMRWSDRGWTDLGPLRLGPPCKGCGGALHVIGTRPGVTYFFRLRKAGVAAPISTEAAATAFYQQPPACDAAGALCLQGRYRIEARYEGNREVAGGLARAVALNEGSGYFWFFGPENIELVAKVLDGCAVNDRRWVFLTGLTSLKVLAVVIDTWTGATSTYLSQAGQPFPTIQDVKAFATCD